MNVERWWPLLQKYRGKRRVVDSNLLLLKKNGVDASNFNHLG